MIDYPSIRSLISMLETIAHSGPRKFEIHVGSYAGDPPPSANLSKSFIMEIEIEGEDADDVLRNEIHRIVGYEPQKMRWWEMRSASN